MQRVRGLERDDPPAGTAVREEQRLQHLVRPVGAEDALGGLAEVLPERVAQRAGGAVRIAVQIGVAQLVEPALDELASAARTGSRSC